MKLNREFIGLTLGLLLSACSLNKFCCKDLNHVSSEASTDPALKATSLSYLINYRPDSYDIVAHFDVLFLSKDSSTNGCTAYIQGKYGEFVKSEELTLTGSSSGNYWGSMGSSITSNRRYYLAGIINRPDTEEIRKQNERALSIHVEENYVIEYLLK